MAQDDISSLRLSVHLQNASLQQALNEISQQSSLHFSYNSRKVKSDKKISLKADNQPLGQILDQICDHYNLQYTIVSRQIVLKPAPEKIITIQTFTLSGHIRDKASSETLPGATIWIKGTQSGAISNAYGFFSLSLPQGIYELMISFVGYKPQELSLNLSGNQRMDFNLELNEELLGEVTIVVDEKQEELSRSQASRVQINPLSLRGMPEFGGENGLIKNLQSFSGVKGHSDGSAFFFVRGGNKDQNLLLMDEAPVYNPAHLFGFYSIINPDVAKEITLYKADHPIEKGDRLSSVVEIQTRDGNMNKTSVEGMWNPLMRRISLEGPIIKEKVSYFVSYRSSSFRWLYRRRAPNADLFLTDLNAKINWRINDNNRIYYAFFFGKDNYTNTSQGATDGLQWQNFTSTLRWNHIFNPRLFSNTTLYVSAYNYSLFTFQTQWISAINNLSLSSDFSYFKTPELTYKFGASLTAHDFNPGNLQTDDNSPFIPHVSVGRAVKTVLYVNREKEINERWAWKAGLRMPIWRNMGPAIMYAFDDSYQVTDTLIFQQDDAIKTFVNLAPRLSLRYRLNPSASLKFSYGTYFQYLHLISNSISPFSSFEIWMPSGMHIKPQKARQLTSAYQHFFEKSKLEFNAELYYKHMSNQIDYADHASLMLNPLVHTQLRFGTAQAYGLEFSLRRTEGRLTGWFSYTLSRVLYQMKDLNQGKAFPAFYDRPHDISIFLDWNVTPRLSIASLWTYYTGSAITTPSGFYQINGQTVPYYSAKNNDRLPDYHRLDFSLNWKLNKNRHSKWQHSISFGVFNLYNRKNPISINFNKVETQNGQFVVPANVFGTHQIMSTQKHLLGIFPSITYKFKI